MLFITMSRLLTLFTICVACAAGAPAALAATISADPNPAAPGDPVRVVGTGFAPLQDGTVTMAASSWPFTADGNGAFTITITVPQLKDATYDLNADQPCQGCVGTTAAFQVSSSVATSPAPTIAPDPAAASPGTSVEVTGDGWASGAAVDLYLTTDGKPGGTPFASPTPDSQGHVAATLAVGEGATPATLTIVACQQCDGEPQATAPFTVLEPPAPTARALESSAARGTRIDVVGERWARGREVSIYLDAADVSRARPIGSLPVDDRGRIGGKVPVPADAALGAHTLVACQECPGREVPFSLDVTRPTPGPTPTLSASPASFAPGATVTVTGAHWRPGRGVRITLASVSIATEPLLGVLPADAAGRIHGTVRVPRGIEPGPHQLVACQDCTRSEASFALTILAPAGGGGSHAVEAAAGGALALCALLGALVLRRPTLAFRRSGWERRAEEDDRPEPCEHRSWYCKRGEPELELEQREIRELALEARGAAPGRGLHVALEDEVVEQANAALAEWRRGAAGAAALASAAVAASLARSIDEHVVPAASSLADVTLVVTVEGGEVSQPYHLRRCQRGDDRACRWVEKATWTATAKLKDARTYRTAVALGLERGEQVDEAGHAALQSVTATLIERIARDHLAARLRPGAELELELCGEE